MEPAGAASRAGIRAGDLLISVDGNPVSDILDLFGKASLTCEVLYRRGGSVRRAHLRRNPADMGWGLRMKGEEPRRCRNRCPFCFVDQNPPGVRQSLLHKDDDVRHSFLDGTYVTLDPDQVDLALERGLSPVYASVHATDPELRGVMLGRRGPAPVVPALRRLRAGGVEVRGQIVVVPGLNDGRHLAETVETLMQAPLVSQLGIVPVGLTGHRDGLAPLRRPTSRESARILSLCMSAGARAVRRGLGRWVWPADELLAMAGAQVPAPDFYEGCALQENGIGLLTRLTAPRGDGRGKGTVVTGTLAAPFLREYLAATGYRVAPAENGFFGPMVGVAGLLTGCDVIAAIDKRKTSGEAGPFFLPPVMFNSDSLTLDDLTLADISRASGARVLVAESLARLP